MKLQVFLGLYFDRVSARPSGLQTIEPSGKAEEQTNEKVEVEPGSTEQPGSFSSMETVTPSGSPKVLPSDISPDLKVSGCEKELLTGTNSDVMSENFEDMDKIDVESASDVAGDISCNAVKSSVVLGSQAVKDLGNIDMVRTNPCSSLVEETSGCVEEEQNDINMAKSGPSPGLPNNFSCCDKNSSAAMDYQNERDSEHSGEVKFTSHYGNGYSSANESEIHVEDAHTKYSGISSLPTETSAAKMHQLKRGSPLYSS